MAKQLASVGTLDLTPAICTQKHCCLIGMLPVYYYCVFTLTRSNVQRLSKAAPFLYSVNGNVTVSIRAFVTDLQVVITYQGNFWRENISEISHVWHKVTAFRALDMSLISSVCVSSSWCVVCCPVRPGPAWCCVTCPSVVAETMWAELA